MGSRPPRWTSTHTRRKSTRASRRTICSRADGYSSRCATSAASSHTSEFRRGSKGRQCRADHRSPSRGCEAAEERHQGLASSRSIGMARTRLTEWLGKFSPDESPGATESYDDYAHLLDAVRGIRWPARSAVRGGIPGTHTSRLRGISAEFTEYRPYRQGDDTRRIDWKLFAR